MFQDRRHAGRELAQALSEYRQYPGALILALPRGGVIVADEVARTLDLPWDVFVSQKIGAPWDPELALGAVSETGTVVLNDDIVHKHPMPSSFLTNSIRCQGFLVQAKERLYRGDRHLPPIEGRTIILIDDGAATGATFLAAAKSVKELRPSCLIAAVPAAPASALPRIALWTDHLIVLKKPRGISNVRSIYRHFETVSDRTVCEAFFRHHRDAKHLRIQGYHPPARVDEEQELETGVVD